ncbi:hypothetical protein Poly59_21540 [Rubripirellula reticaptiva]|uniref:Uncharacterized protein n=2 Tax=Rubripirellula reticaptiva TaxID=2528013 RepID=A0A5C6F8J9_9BACT|nr:hypothetical protein Poly59_21540 [Rubripirellula reticaptiva]
MFGRLGESPGSWMTKPPLARCDPLNQQDAEDIRYHWTTVHDRCAKVANARSSETANHLKSPMQ